MMTTYNNGNIWFETRMVRRGNKNRRVKIPRRFEGYFNINDLLQRPPPYIDPALFPPV